MTGFIIFACIVLFFAFILSLKATVSVEYNGELALFVRVLFIKIKVIPKKEKKRPRSMSAKKAQKIKATKAHRAQKPKIQSRMWKVNYHLTWKISR